MSCPRAIAKNVLKTVELKRQLLELEREQGHLLSAWVQMYEDTSRTTVEVDGEWYLLEITDGRVTGLSPIRVYAEEKK